MIKAIYSHVSSCVKLSNNSNISDCFNVAIGLKQGEPLSPRMSILFVNDISNIVDFNNLTDLDIAQLSLYLPIFADDIAVFTNDNQSLQSLLNNIYTYSNNWGLTMLTKRKFVFLKKDELNIISNGS